ncbi:MAG: Lrp/AsnC ligand binding domain-containing protein [Rikenellaceae bacterium]
MGNEVIFDELDKKILGLITNNARISFLEVARICNVSGAAVHQRVQKMTTGNIITGSEFTLNSSKIGYNTCAFVKLNFSHTHNLDEMVLKLKEIPEIVECHHTTGNCDLLVKIYTKNNAHLHQIIQTRIKPLGLESSESVISFNEPFRRQLNLSKLITK